MCFCGGGKWGQIDIGQYSAGGGGFRWKEGWVVDVAEKFLSVYGLNDFYLLFEWLAQTRLRAISTCAGLYVGSLEQKTHKRHKAARQ